MTDEAHDLNEMNDPGMAELYATRRKLAEQYPTVDALFDHLLEMEAEAARTGKRVLVTKEGRSRWVSRSKLIETRKQTPKAA